MKNDLFPKVFDIVEKIKEESLTFLRELISFPSLVGTNYEDIQGSLRNRLKGLGAKVDMWEPDMQEMRQSRWFTAPLEYYPEGFRGKPVVVGHFPGTGGGSSLILNGHIEVVTPGPMDLWTSSPWGGGIRDGRMYGRGVIDCKGGVAAAIQAIAAITRAGIKLKGNIWIESVYDEEIGGTGTLAAILRGYKADAAIVTEPTHRRIIIARPGIMWLRIIVKGKSAHAARLWEGTNAITKALKVHEKISRYGERRMELVRDPLFADFPIHATFNAGTFKAGGYPSSVPDEAVLEYRIGTLPSENNETVLEEIRSLIHAVAAEDPWLREHQPELSLFGWYGIPYKLDPQEPIVKCVSDSYEHIYGQLPSLRGATASNDSWLLNSVGKIPTLTFGNNGGNHHQNDEFINLEDYQNLIKILAATILKWCSV